MNIGNKGPVYDRELLLKGAKRNAVLDLTEVQRYGIESWGDPDYVCIYGLRPADWYGKGIRILGRTAVECTRDKLADNIGRDIAAVASSVPLTSSALIIEPFPARAIPSTGCSATYLLLMGWDSSKIPSCSSLHLESSRSQSVNRSVQSRL